MEKCYSIFGIKKSEKKESHYLVCDGFAKDENEIKATAESIKKNGFFYQHVLIFPDSVGVVIYLQRTYPFTPIVEKQYII